MSNKFCRFLSNGKSLMLKPNGGLNVRPCCWYKGPDLRTFDVTEKEEWLPGCRVCQEQESAGHHSYRQSSFEIIDKDSSYLDIAIDYECNAACVMCGPHLSTTWEKLVTNKKVLEIKTNLSYEKELQEILTTNDLDRCQRVKFSGGEPFLTKTYQLILDRITNPENVTVWFTTNGSVELDDDTLEYLSKFKNVFYEVSIDGIDKQFEYIRWPLLWSKVSQNLINLKQRAPGNLIFRVSHTLNPFNVYYYDRVEQWVDQNLKTNRDGDPTDINIHPCWGTWGLDRTPQRLRDVIDNNTISSLLNTQAQSDITPLKEFVNKWDPIRKTNWKQTFPEIIDYFELD